MFRPGIGRKIRNAESAFSLTFISSCILSSTTCSSCRFDLLTEVLHGMTSLFRRETIQSQRVSDKKDGTVFSFHLWDDFMLVVFFWASPTLECGWRCFYSKHVMYSAKWLGETRFFSLTMRPIIQTHKHIIRMTQNTVAYVRQSQRRQGMQA